MISHGDHGLSTENLPEGLTVFSPIVVAVDNHLLSLRKSRVSTFKSSALNSCAYNFSWRPACGVVISWGRCVTMFHRSSVLLLAAVRGCDIIGDVTDASLLLPGGMDWRLLYLLIWDNDVVVVCEMIQYNSQ